MAFLGVAPIETESLFFTAPNSAGLGWAIGGGDENAIFGVGDCIAADGDGNGDSGIGTA